MDISIVIILKPYQTTILILLLLKTKQTGAFSSFIICHFVYMVCIAIKILLELLGLIIFKFTLWKIHRRLAIFDCIIQIIFFMLSLNFILVLVMEGGARFFIKVWFVEAWCSFCLGGKGSVIESDWLIAVLWLLILLLRHRRVRALTLHSLQIILLNPHKLLLNLI